MINWTVTDRRNQQTRQFLAFKNGAETVKFDFAPWEVNNGSVSAITWTVKNGDASISNKSLSSSIASAVITTPNPGNSTIEMAATAGNHTHKEFIRVVSKDPHNRPNDYGFCD